MSFNKIILVGNLGKDPELRYTPQGTAVCSFNLATNKKGKDGQEVTTWFRVTLWDKRALVAERYLKRGSGVYIEGTLEVSEFTGRDGDKKYTLEVTATDMQFIGSRDSEVRDASGDIDGNVADDRRPSLVQDAMPLMTGQKDADDDIPF